MALTKPPVLPAWAEAGDKVQPSNAEIQAGWPLSNVPPSRQRFNWLLNFLANGIRYLTRRGMPDYGADETYMIGDRVIGDDGKTYRSIQDNNTGNTPSASPLWWERWGFGASELSTELNKLDYKTSCRVATTANLAALSGLLTIDGVVLVAGDRVLVKDQAVGSQNGIYVAAVGAWDRAADADDGAKLNSGAIVPVEAGTVNGDTLWMLTTDGGITVGVTALAFSAVNGNVGTPGTYTQVTVDSKGRVVSGTSTSSYASPVRQTVLGGPIDASGYPSFLPPNSAALSINSQNITAGYPLVVSSANGFGSSGAVDRVGKSTVNLTWNGLSANATNYLYVDVAADGTLTTGSTNLAPVYQNGGARSSVNGQATFNVAEMSMTVGNGVAANQAYRVFVGEAVTNAGAVTSTVAYAYQGLYDTGWFAVSNSSNYAKNHNIGHLDLNTQTWVNSTASEAGKYQADTSGGYTGSVSISTGIYKKFDTRNSMTFQTGSGAVFAIYRGGAGDINLGGSAFCRSVVKRGW